MAYRVEPRSHPRGIHVADLHYDVAVESEGSASKAGVIEDLLTGRCIQTLCSKQLDT